MPAGIGRKYIGDMFAKIGARTPVGRASMELGMGGAMAATRRKKLMRYGAMSTAGYGAAGISMLSTSRSTGNYKPAPINPISSPQGSGRYA